MLGHLAETTITIGQGAADSNSITQKVNDFLAAPGVGYIVGFFQVLAIVWLGFSLGHKMFKAAKDRQYSQLGIDAVLFILAAIIIIKPTILIAFLIWISQKFSGN